MPRFTVGDVVLLREDPGVQGAILALETQHAGEQYYRVFINGQQEVRAAGSLLPFRGGEKPTDALAGGEIADFDAFQRLLTFHRARRRASLSNHYYAFNASRTRFYPHQFKPLIKFLDSPTGRILIADEVGLGKTIEAGLILTELEARQYLDRILVVCPATLTGKWQQELKQRFDQDFEIARAARFREFLDQYAHDPAQTRDRLIVSLETVRSARLLGRIEAVAPRFDLVIVDEAHHLRNSGRNQHEAGKLLAGHADATVFLTATPIQLGRENLFTLLNLLEPDSFVSREEGERLFVANAPVVRCQSAVGQVPPAIDIAQEELHRAGQDQRISEHPEYPAALARMKDLATEHRHGAIAHDTVLNLQMHLNRINLLGHIFTRTRKREVQNRRAVRRAMTPHVELTDLEQDFYDAVTRFVRAQNRTRRGGGRGSGFLLVTPQRRMASSIPAMVRYYRAQVGAVVEDEPEDQDEPATAVTEDPELLVHALRDLRRVIGRWPLEGGPDSKYDALRSVLTGLRQERERLSILVFAFYKDTLHYLQDRLQADGFRCAVICGDVPNDQRPTIIERFRNGDVEVLLSSRVGSEGLDFQFCSSLVNYDLPWNPMEIEQRIGRLDRLGQESETIGIYNLHATGTIEARIMERLHQRVGVFEDSIGDLEDILGTVVKELEQDLFRDELTAEEEEERLVQAERIVQERRRQMEELEGEAASFIGTDRFFDEEVRRIRDHHRYVTEKQLVSFVTSFLGKRCPRTHLQYDLKTGRGRLRPDAELQALLHANPERRCPPEFLNPPAGGLKVTFNSQTAFDDPTIAFINVVHPLVQMMVDELDHEGSLASAHHLVLSQGRLPGDLVADCALVPGNYVYFAYRHAIKAARSTNTLEFVLLDDRLQLAVPVSRGEEVLGRLLEFGSTPEQGAGRLPEDLAREASRAAEQHFLAHARKLENHHRETNEAFIERRLDVLESHYRRLIAAQEHRLSEGRRKGAQPHYLRMVEGTISRLVRDLELARRKIAENREVGASHEEIAAGIIELVP